MLAPTHNARLYIISYHFHCFVVCCSVLCFGVEAIPNIYLDHRNKRTEYVAYTCVRTHGRWIYCHRQCQCQWDEQCNGPETRVYGSADHMSSAVPLPAYTTRLYQSRDLHVYCNTGTSILPRIASKDAAVCFTKSQFLVNIKTG